MRRGRRDNGCILTMRCIGSPVELEDDGDVV